MVFFWQIYSWKLTKLRSRWRSRAPPTTTPSCCRVRLLRTSWRLRPKSSYETGSPVPCPRLARFPLLPTWEHELYRLHAESSLRGTFVGVWKRGITQLLRRAYCAFLTTSSWCSTYVPRGLCNLAAIAFVVWASDTTCTTHTIHETPLRRFEKEPAVVPNMLAVLTGGIRAVAKMAERSDMFERWYRSTNFLTAFWAYMGPAAQEFWGSDDVLRPDLLVGRWAHLLFACL